MTTVHNTCWLMTTTFIFFHWQWTVELRIDKSNKKQQKKNISIVVMIVNHPIQKWNILEVKNR